MKLGIPALVLAVGVAACSVTEENAEPSSDAVLPAEEAAGRPAPPKTSTAPAQCERSAAGQVACFTKAFELENCDGAKVLGSMFRENEAEGTHEFRTAFGIDADCRSELETAMQTLGFRDKGSERGKGTFVTNASDGYRQTMIFGLQVSPDGSIVEWERIQE